MSKEDSMTVYRAYRIASSALALGVSIGLTIYIFYIYFETTVLSSWHPAFLTLGYVFLMADGILAVNKDNIVHYLFPDLQKTVKKQHTVLEVLAAIFILAGLLTEVVLKERNSSSHFASDHAILGLVAIICCFITCFGGIFTYFSVKFKNVFKPTHNKLLHTVIGVVSFILGIAAQGTGYYTRRFESYPQLACTILTVIPALIVIEGALTSAYSRFRRL